MKKPTINRTHHSTKRWKSTLIAGASLFILNTDSAFGQSRLFFDTGTREAWDGYVGYKPGITTDFQVKKTGNSSLRSYVHKDYNHRADVRKFDIGGNNLGATRRYIFNVRGEKIRNLIDADMGNWIYQTMLQFIQDGNQRWKPLNSISYGGGQGANQWSFHRYSRTGRSPKLHTHLLTTNAKADQSKWVRYAVRVNYRTNNTGRIIVWRNGVRILDKRNIQTWFSDVNQGNLVRHHFGLMNYLVHRYKGNVTNVTTRFDDIRVLDY